jgi:hypothetical protein
MPLQTLNPSLMKRPYRGCVVKSHLIAQLGLVVIGLVAVLVISGQLARV